jgi:hypothetical protein
MLLHAPEKSPLAFIGLPAGKNLLDFLPALSNNS